MGIRPCRAWMLETHTVSEVVPVWRGGGVRFRGSRGAGRWGPCVVWSTTIWRPQKEPDVTGWRGPRSNPVGTGKKGSRTSTVAQGHQHKYQDHEHSGWKEGLEPSPEFRVQSGGGSCSQGGTAALFENRNPNSIDFSWQDQCRGSVTTFTWRAHAAPRAATAACGQQRMA